MFRPAYPVGLLLVLVVTFVACKDKNDTIQTPVPTQPKLVSGGLLGTRVCGDITVHATTYSFDCTSPLPTIETTGWKLTPLLKPPNALGTQWPNRAIVLKVTTPSLNNLDVKYIAETGPQWTLIQVPDGVGEPAPVNSRGEVGVATADDGTTKTWTLQFILDTCTPEAQIAMRAVSPSTNTSSSPLKAELFRDPNELECTSGAGGVFYATTGPKPPNPRPQNPGSGPCANGGKPQTFGVCENCANGHPPSMNRWSAGQYCDVAEVMAVYGYTDPLINPTPKAQTCTVRIEPNRANCERP